MLSKVGIIQIMSLVTHFAHNWQDEKLLDYPEVNIQLKIESRLREIFAGRFAASGIVFQILEHNIKIIFQ
jgi:hypothetical protein